MYGLYDTDGILRFVGGDQEACFAYAELFEMQAIECCLIDLPESHTLGLKNRKKVRRAKSNN